MTEWLFHEPEEHDCDFDERLTVWLMKHPTWALLVDRETERIRDPALGYRWLSWPDSRRWAYFTIREKYGGKDE